MNSPDCQVNADVGDDEEQHWDSSSDQQTSPVDVVVDIVGVSPQLSLLIVHPGDCDIILICVVTPHNFVFKELWNVDDNSQNHRGNNKCSGMEATKKY